MNQEQKQARMELVEYGICKALVFPYYAEASYGLRLLNQKVLTGK